MSSGPVLAPMKTKTTKTKHGQPKQGNKEQPVWTPFVRTGQVVPAHPDGTPAGVVWANSAYIVIVRTLEPKSQASESGEEKGMGTLIWLSIRRQENDAVHDWRHLQRIKNELAGPETEAVELYPAESRLVDGANQYHLWCFPGFRFPFGFNERHVADHPGLPGACQRPHS